VHTVIRVVELQLRELATPLVRLHRKAIMVDQERILTLVEAVVPHKPEIPMAMDMVATARPQPFLARL
jgi:hypothetical protein